MNTDTALARQFIAPNVTSMSVIQTDRTSVQLEVQLSYGQVFVYCAAWSPYDTARSTRPSSFAAVMSQGIFAFASDDSATVSLTELVPATTYSIVCGTVTQKSVALSYLLTMRSLISASTECCKVLTVTPQVTTTTAGSFVSNYLTLSLSAVPSKAVMVIVSFVPSNRSRTEVNEVALFPAQFVFTNSSLSQTTQASLNSQVTAAGSYNMSVRLTGSSAAEFTTTVVSGMRLLVSATVVEPVTPKVQSAARYSSDGSYLTVSFDAATNRAGYVNNFPCNALFSFVGMGRSTCLWRDAVTIEVY